MQESLVRAVEDMAPRLLSVSHEIHAPYRPKRGHRETGMGDGAPCGRDSVGDGAPYGRDSVAPTISRSQER